MATDLSEKILKHLDVVGDTDTLAFSKIVNEDHNKVIGAVKSLQALGDVITAEAKVNKIWELTEEGKEIVKSGSHEMHIFRNVPPEGITLSKLMLCLPDKKVCTVGFNKAMSAGWLTVDKSQSEALVKRKNNPEFDTVQEHLKLILKNDGGEVPLGQKQDYKKRKLLQEVVITSYSLSKGANFTTQLLKEANDLTVDMLTTGSWKEQVFKPYNFNALGTPPSSGHLHPLLKVRTQIRQIFLEMGFTEMPTNNYVENSFWNFDALFQPQQHPARDAHDTFFLSEPAGSSNFPRDYLEKVKEVHSVGGYGSQGYGYDWKESEACKNLLRTHTTAVSARMLYKLAQEGFHPIKYFSIDRVFRNETLDATHLAEFQQVEGVVADYNLTLGNLIGIFYEFFRKLGMEQLQFKPAYNPYTEPSMEIFSFHSGLGKWIEVGNSGLFRPEMLLPMGLPKNVNVIAWGLSLERPTMIKYGLNNIRDLVGPKVDLHMVYNNPICRLDKNGSSLQDVVGALDLRWESILSQLRDLTSDVKTLHGAGEGTSVICTEKINVVIFVNPKCIPYSLIILLKLLSSVYSVTGSVHVHSSIDYFPQHLDNLISVLKIENGVSANIVFTFVWKDIAEITLVEDPISHTRIIGEVNILRYFSRVFDKSTKGIPLYEKRGLKESALIDMWLDQTCISFRKLNNKHCKDILHKLSKHLQNNLWLVGISPSLADIAVWSALKQSLSLNITPYIRKWYERCSKHIWFKLDFTIEN